jgi:hypothetical protein
LYDSAILLGILVSLFFTELTGLSAGLVVPGYLVLCLHAPWRIVYTLLIALVGAVFHLRDESLPANFLIPFP